MKILCVCKPLAFLVAASQAQIFSEEMVLATHKLFNEKSTATGFVLQAEDGRRFLISAAHVFEKMEGESAVLVSRTQDEGTYGDYQRKDVKIAVRDGEKLKTFTGTQTTNHPLWLATVAQAGVIRETLDLAMEKKEAEGVPKREQPASGKGEDE